MWSLSEHVPQVIFPHNILCMPWLWQITIDDWKRIFLVEAVIVPMCKINSSCKCIVFLPLVSGVIMSKYLDCGKSWLFLSGRISEQALLWDISALLIPACNMLFRKFNICEGLTHVKEQLFWEGDLSSMYENLPFKY